ncbi:Protein FAM63A isoform X1 [Oopsacas minuta]|uniref:Ubiquitin carboxyl-terminal hydrolase n=1 Tax=Oopsacas minuta TaxID=111878 RepID=A0AAV7K2W0_9METZ|nr:Protein FAM63A isoform X1 [Oopsacas minuta]
MTSDVQFPQSTTQQATREGPTDISEGESWYEIKWILWNSKRLPILVQNKNGPCPLIALCNVLFLRGAVNIKSNLEIISSEGLLQLLLNQMLEGTPKTQTEGETLNYQQNIQDTIAILPKLHTGLDLNVKFNRVDAYEFTDTVGVFDLLNVNLYHGWIFDPANPVYHHAVGEKTYNQLVEMVISDKNSNDPDKLTTATSAEEFLTESASQLTFHGLIELHKVVLEEEFCVFFRNNHFNTLLRRGGKLYLLVTDYGFLNESRFVWEALDTVDGDTQFFDSSFNLVSTSDNQVSVLEGAHSTSKTETPKEATAESSAPHQSHQIASQADSDKYNFELAEKLVREAQLKEDEALAWKMMSEESSSPPPPPPPSPPSHVVTPPRGAEPSNIPAPGDSTWDERLRQQDQEQSRIRHQREGRTQIEDDIEDTRCGLL